MPNGNKKRKMNNYIHALIIDNKESEFNKYMDEIENHPDKKTKIGCPVMPEKDGRFSIKTTANFSGFTPLMVAIAKRRVGMVKKLLEAGVDPNVALSSGKLKGLSPLAAAFSNIEMFQLLLERGADPKLSSLFILSDHTFIESYCFVQAILDSNLAVIKLLLPHVTHEMIVSGVYQGHTPLMLAIEILGKKQTLFAFEIVKILISHFHINLHEIFANPEKFKWNQSAAYVRSILNEALQDTQLLEAALELGEMKAQPEEDRTYLSYLIAWYPKISQKQIEEIFKVADIDWTTDPSALYWAAEFEKLPLVKSWLPQVKNVNAVVPDGHFQEGETALIAACKGDTPKTVEALLDAGANVEQRATFGRSKNFSPLMTAAGADKLELVRILLARGASADEMNVLGHGALSQAAYRDHPEVVKLLLEFSRFPKGTVPTDESVSHLRTLSLIYAIQNNSLPIYSALRNVGVNLDAEVSTEGGVNVSGVFLSRKTITAKPIHTAIRVSNLVLLSDLLQRGVDSNSTISKGPDEGLTPICCAVMNGFYDAIERLINHGANINFRVKTGYFTGLTASAIAISKGHDVKDLEILFKHHANPNDVVYGGTKEEVPLLLYVARQKNFAAARCLLANGADAEVVVPAGLFQGQSLWAIALSLFSELPEFVIALLEHKKVSDRIIEKVRQGTNPLKAAEDESDSKLLAFLFRHHGSLSATPVAQSFASKAEEVTVKLSDSNYWLKNPKEKNKLNVKVACEHWKNPEQNILLLNARFESDLVFEIILKQEKTNNDFYVLRLHLLRKYEALYRYAQQTGDNSIIAKNYASNVRNMLMHSFHHLDKQALFDFAKVDCETTHVCLLQKLGGEDPVNFGKTSIVATPLYQSLESKLQVADTEFNSDQLVMRIIEEMQALVFAMASKEKNHIVFFTAINDEIKMRLTCIGQYARVLKITDDKFEMFAEKLTLLLNDPEDKLSINKTLFFLHRCMQVRGIIGHEFSDQVSIEGVLAQDDRISANKCYNLLTTARQISKAMIPDYGFVLRENLPQQAVFASAALSVNSQ